MLEISDSSFETEVIQSDRPVIVDFWAPWCAPCKIISPILEALDVSFGDVVKFVKFNVDENPITPNQYGIMAIPNLVFFKNGRIANQIVGAVQKSVLEEAIDKILK